MIQCQFEHDNKHVELRHMTTAAIIVMDDQVLLTRRGYYQGRKLSEFGKWTLPGGYMQKGETLIQSVIREIKEETGCNVTNLKFFRIVDSPLRRNDEKQNLSVVFVCDYVSQTGKSDSETLELGWFQLSLLPERSEIAFDFADDLALYTRLRKGEKVADTELLPADLFKMN